MDPLFYVGYCFETNIYHQSLTLHHLVFTIVLINHYTLFGSCRDLLYFLPQTFSNLDHSLLDIFMICAIGLLQLNQVALNLAVQFLESLDLFTFLSLSSGHKRSLGLYSSLRSHAGHHLLLISLYFDLQFDLGFSHLLSMMEYLMRHINIKKLIGDFWLRILP